MYPLEIVMGVSGTLILGTCFYLAYTMFRAFSDNAEMTATTLFLQGAVVSSLRVLILGSFIFVVSGLLTLLGYYWNDPVLVQSIRVGSMVLFLAYLYFHITIARNTSPEN